MDLQKASDHQESCASPKRSRTRGILNDILDSIDCIGTNNGGSGMKDYDVIFGDDGGEDKQELGDDPPITDVFFSFDDENDAKPVVSQISKPDIFAPSCTSLIGDSAARSILKSSEDVTAKRKAAKKVRFSDILCMRTYRKNAKDIKDRREFVQEILAKNRKKYDALLIRRRIAFQNARRRIEDLEFEDSE